jgi:hypothetical protein
MTAKAQPKLPPARVARVIGSARRRLRRIERQLRPPTANVLDIMTGSRWLKLSTR